MPFVSAELKNENLARSGEVEQARSGGTPTGCPLLGEPLGSLSQSLCSKRRHRKGERMEGSTGIEATQKISG